MTKIKKTTPKTGKFGKPLSDCTHRNTIISTKQEREAWEKEAAKHGLSFSRWGKNRLNGTHIKR